MSDLASSSDCHRSFHSAFRLDPVAEPELYRSSCEILLRRRLFTQLVSPSPI